jgi:2-isopropylmalate synthase
MTPASVGVGERNLVLGKHSGKHAVEARLRSLGVHLAAHQVEDVTARVKELADRKKFVYDEDLLAIVSAGSEGRVRLLRYQAVSGNHLLPTASVEVEVDGERRSASAVGNGPLDASLRAVDAALGQRLELLELHTRAVTSGTDALAEVIVRVRQGDQEAVGQAASTDSIEASVRAYVSAVGALKRSREAEPAAGPSAVRFWPSRAARQFSSLGGA